jgi:hypothetical protein
MMTTDLATGTYEPKLNTTGKFAALAEKLI